MFLGSLQLLLRTFSAFADIWFYCFPIVTETVTFLFLIKFLGFHLVASVTMACFGGCRQLQQFFYFLILLFTSLHVSASTGHPQVKYIYTVVFLKAIMPATDPFYPIQSLI
jgi:hypothetical protein